MKTLRAVICFALVQAVMWGFAWLCGYDFDSRNLIVALWALCSVVVAIVTAMFAYVWQRGDAQDIVDAVLGDMK